MIFMLSSKYFVGLHLGGVADEPAPGSIFLGLASVEALDAPLRSSTAA
jgi:hypothetical protein